MVCKRRSFLIWKNKGCNVHFSISFTQKRRLIKCDNCCQNTSISRKMFFEAEEYIWRSYHHISWRYETNYFTVIFVYWSKNIGLHYLKDFYINIKLFAWICQYSILHKPIEIITNQFLRGMTEAITNSLLTITLRHSLH